MTYLYYQYCFSDFVIAGDYRMEYFTEERNLDFYYQTLLKNIASYTQTEIQKPQELIRRIYVPMVEIDKYINDEKNFHTYDPLSDTPELYLEMNKIVIYDKNSLMKFIKNYGLPYHLTMQKNESGIFDSTLFQGNDTEKFILEMDVLMFYEKLARFQKVLKMWNYIIEGNVLELNKIKHEFESLVEFHNNHQALFTEDISLEDYANFVFTDSAVHYRGGEMREVFNVYANDSNKLLKLNEKSLKLKSIWKQVKNGSDLKTIALAYLNLQLKEIKGGEPLHRFIEDKLFPAMRFDHLLDVAGYQLKQAIFKNQKLERCVNCGALFEPRHASQKFCSPLPGRKRSTCENTYNQRLKRLRKKQELDRS